MELMKMTNITKQRIYLHYADNDKINLYTWQHRQNNENDKADENEDIDEKEPGPDDASE